MTKHMYFSETQSQYITFINFVDSFHYTSMPQAAGYLRAFHPILFIKSNGSFECKNDKEI